MVPLCGANETDAQRILLMGGTLAFGGPIHPAVLGAGIASAALHLSPEHEDRQGRLYERIDLVNQLVVECGLPVPSVARTPISFVRIGMSDQVIRMAKILMANGFFVNPPPTRRCQGDQGAFGSRSPPTITSPTSRHSFHDCGIHGCS